MLEFKEINTSRVLNLIKEADDSKAFLQSVSDPEFSVERFLSQEKLQGYKLFGVSNETGRMKGFISIKSKDEDTIVIGPMYITESARGKGLGKWQVEQLIGWARTNNISTILTKTWSENKGSRKIFEGLGFELIEIQPNARINGDSTIKYKKSV